MSATTMAATAPTRSLETDQPAQPSRYGAVVHTMATNAGTMALGFAGSVLAARLLGPGGRGELAAVVTWGALAVAIGDLGVSQACIYYGAKSRSREGVVIGTALAVGVSVALVLVCGVLLLRSRLFPVYLARLASVYMLTVPLTVAATYIAAILQGMNRLGAFNVVRLVQASGYTVAIAATMLTREANAVAVVRAILLCQCAATAISLIIACRLLPLRTWRPEPPMGRRLLAYGVRSYPGNLFWLANGRLDQALLSLLAPMRELGIYAVAVSYAGILFGLSAALASIVFPRIAGATTAEAGRQELRRMLRTLALITLPLAGLMALVARWVIPGVFGAAFRAGTMPAYVLLGGGALLGLNYVLSNALRASGRPGLPAIAEAAGLVVTALGLPLALPRWGITGAAWVSLLSYGLTALFLWRFQAAAQSVEG